MKPVIGVFTPIDDDGMQMIFREYTEALEGAGAIPILVANTDSPADIEQLAEMCDGFCFTGGVDVDPMHYGEEKLPECGEIQKKRDALELLAIPILLRSGKPILGICRGAQVINIALGGSLYQDIPSQIKTDITHSQTCGRYEFSHDTNIIAGTPLSLLTYEARVTVNSFHHQSVKTLGKGLKVMSRADDGVVEAMYLDADSYMRLYQWHPERLVSRDALSRAIFDDFVNATIKRG